MNALAVELLVGLYFIGVALPGFLINPITRSVLVQLVYGLILVILAYLGYGVIQ